MRSGEMKLRKSIVNKRRTSEVRCESCSVVQVGEFDVKVQDSVFAPIRFGFSENLQA